MIWVLWASEKWKDRETHTNTDIQRQPDKEGKRSRQRDYLGTDLVCKLAVQVLDLGVGLRAMKGQRETQIYRDRPT